VNPSSPRPRPTPPNTSYHREVLFSLGYGTGDDQVKVDPPNPVPMEGDLTEGPKGLQVSPSGNIYINDYYNGCVKVFSPRGKLIYRTQGKLDNTQISGVDSAGVIYLFNSGRHGGGDFLTRFTLRGKPIRSVPIEGLPYWIYPGPEGTVGLVVAPKIDLYTGKGKLRLRRKGDGCNAAGEPFRIFDLNPYGPLRQRGIKLSVLNISTNHLERTVVLRPDEQVIRLLAGIRFGIGTLRLDSVGRPFTDAVCARKNPFTIGKAWVFGSDDTVVQYHRDGTPASAVRFGGGPLVTDPWNITIDGQGNVYHLEFTTKHMEVVRYHPLHR